MQSAVDLTLATTNLVNKCRWNIMDDTFGSDHFIIVTELDILSTEIQKCIRPISTCKWKDKDANWVLYEEVITNQMDKETTGSNKLESLINCINTAAAKSIPTKSKVVRNKTGSYWWGTRCSAMVTLRRETIKKYKTNPNIENYIECKNVIA